MCLHFCEFLIGLPLNTSVTLFCFVSPAFIQTPQQIKKMKFAFPPFKIAPQRFARVLEQTD